MYKEVAPNPSALIFSLRSIGYDVMTAIADILDNSISADANNIEINFSWNNGNSIVTIEDNGHGMNDEELINAMRLGDKSPLDKRDKNDLGRFSMGLKTASFSQCKKLTVFSKRKNKKICGKCWDLDHILESKRWNLKDMKENNLDLGTPQDQGTIVIWEKIDKFPEKEEAFYSMIKDVEEYLSQIFHDLMRDIQIKINGNYIKAWDPFLTSNSYTEKLREEKIGGVKIIPYILPHDSNLSEEEKEHLKGIKGWSGHQGFYIYRNNRLIINGDWLGTYTKDDHYKLARIRIEIDNTSDFEWEIDIKKSKAKIPIFIRKSLKRIATRARENAVKKYRHRGKQLTRKLNINSTYVWECNENRGAYKYKVNMQNEIVKKFMNENKISKRSMNSFLKLIEETIPITTIISNSEVHREAPIKPYDKQEKELKKMISDLYKAFIINMNEENVKRTLLGTEPFNHYPEIVESVIEEIKNYE